MRAGSCLGTWELLCEVFGGTEVLGRGSQEFNRAVGCLGEQLGQCSLADVGAVGSGMRAPLLGTLQGVPRISVWKGLEVFGDPVSCLREAVRHQVRCV